MLDVVVCIPHGFYELLCLIFRKTAICYAGVLASFVGKQDDRSVAVLEDACAFLRGKAWCGCFEKPMDGRSAEFELLL